MCQFIKSLHKVEKISTSGGDLSRLSHSLKDKQESTDNNYCTELTFAKYLDLWRATPQPS